MQDYSQPDGPAQVPFTAATAVTACGAGDYEACLDPRFAYSDKINGGYLLAVATRAATSEASTPGVAPLGPVSAVAHYLRPAEPGPAQVRCTVIGSGGSTRRVHARMTQGDRDTLDAVITFRRTERPPAADGTAAGTPAWSDGSPPVLPPRTDCIQMPVRPPGAAFEVPLMGVVDQHLDPACLGFALGAPTGAGQLRGWVSLPGLAQVDAPGLVLLADALPPAVFDLGHSGWVPTLSLTVHLVGIPAPGPLQVRQQVHGMRDGLVSQVCDLWDSRDALVAHATQLATVAEPRTMAEPPEART